MGGKFFVIRRQKYSQYFYIASHFCLVLQTISSPTPSREISSKNISENKNNLYIQKGETK